MRKAVVKTERYKLKGGYIYRFPFEDIVAGFMFERGSGGYYVWRFNLPLYDGNTLPHLTFGRRLDGQIGFVKEEVAESSAAEDIVYNIICANDSNVIVEMTLGGFLDSLDIGEDGNINAYFSAICTWILIGKFDAAFTAIKHLVEGRRLIPYGDLSHRSAELLFALSEGHSEAQTLIKNWEAKARTNWL